MIKLATASPGNNALHHNWVFSQCADGTFVAKRTDGQKILRRRTAAEINDLLSFFKSKGFFVRKYKSLQLLAP